MSAHTTALTGRAWVFGDNIDTDVLAPGIYMKGSIAELAQHCLESVDPDFARNVQRGDILVAGENFGMGSSREQAGQALLELGVSALVAKSFARIFYRNAINIGLPVAVGDPGEARDGDELQVNLVTGEVLNLTRDHKLQVEPVPKTIRPILAEGGLIAYIRRHGRLSREPGHA